MNLSEACKFKVIIDNVNYAAVAVCKNSGNSFITNSNLRKKNNISKCLYNLSSVFKSNRTVKFAYYGCSIIHKSVVTYHKTLSTILIQKLL